jgi:adenylate cyclase
MTDTGAVEAELLGGHPQFTRAEVASAADVPLDQARALWRALGFADVGDEDRAFTDRDLDALRTVRDLVAAGVIDDEMQVVMTRALGQSLARLAEWQVNAVADLLGDLSVPTDAATDVVRDYVPVMEKLIGYVWRRHLAAAAGRLLSGGADEQTVARPQAVGFADLVGFTSLTRHLDEDAFAALVARFEEVTGDTVAECSARVVKTVGDEVMFVTDDPAAAAELALRLAEEVEADEQLPELRVGVAYGEVLARLGDVYGEPVNLASRLTTIARPGSVLVDRSLATALEADPRYRLRRVPPRPVRGYSLLQGFRLRRADPEPAGAE